MALLFGLSHFYSPKAAAADSAFQAYDATPIFGESREVVRMGGYYAYCFPFRNGTVTYRPHVGASWSKGGNSDSLGYIASAPSGAGSTAASRLPNSCLLFACAKAEEIRRGVARDRSNSQVITFRRTDGTGHAFVVYQRGSQTYGEDDRGAIVPVSNWSRRDTASALKIAQEFSVQTHPAGYSSPCQAAFVGEY